MKLDRYACDVCGREELDADSVGVVLQHQVGTKEDPVAVPIIFACDADDCLDFHACRKCVLKGLQEQDK